MLNPTPRRKAKPAPAPIRTGSYAAATAPLLQGRRSNKTQGFLEGIVADPASRQQVLWDHALTDLPGGRTFAAFKQALASPEGPRLIDEYARANHLDRAPTREQYAQAMYEQARARFMARAAQNPGLNLFEGAPMEAYSRYQMEQGNDNLLNGAASEGMAPSAAELRRSYAKYADPGSMKVAPGAVGVVRRVAPAQQPAAPVPRRRMASR